MSQKLISVIIPIYSIKKCISKCLESITNQTYKNLEILIIDNHPKPIFSDIYNKFAKKDNRIKIITTTSSDVNNLGLNLATGDYVHFISSCDYISPDYYEKMLNSVLPNNSDIAISGFNIGNENIIYKTNTLYNRIKDKVNITELNKYEFIFRYLFKKDFLTTNKIKFNKENSVDDLLFLMKSVFFANNIATVPNVMYFHTEE